jgi:hypothetical protein
MNHIPKARQLSPDDRARLAEMLLGKLKSVPE